MEAFWKRILKTDSCWIASGYKTNGYTHITRLGVKQPFHRFVYEYHNGPIQKGMVLDHLCRVRHCVNPDHLEAVSNAENIRRGETGKHQTIKTHCPYNHEYTEENTLVYKSRRHCRKCKKWRDTHRGIATCEQPKGVL